MSHMKAVSNGVVTLFVYHISPSGREVGKEVVTE